MEIKSWLDMDDFRGGCMSNQWSLSFVRAPSCSILTGDAEWVLTTCQTLILSTSLTLIWPLMPLTF